MLEELGVAQDGRSNVKTDQGKYATSVEGVFAAGDCRSDVALDCTLDYKQSYCAGGGPDGTGRGEINFHQDV